jgi:hypothetical protein
MKITAEFTMYDLKALFDINVRDILKERKRNSSIQKWVELETFHDLATILAGFMV